MGLASEIYLTKKEISKNDWAELIKSISHYNGIFQTWKLIITNDKNLIRYFVQSKCSLPATLNNLNSFLLKKSEINDINYQKRKFYLTRFYDSLIDIINNTEIKNKGTVDRLEIMFRKITPNKIRSKIYIYLRKSNISYKYRILGAIPINLLSLDFEGNKRYFYKSAPKYLDINKCLHLLNSDSSSALLKVDTFPYLQGDFYLNQTSYNFDKHSIILGSSGSGKSKFISSIISNINNNCNLKAKYKVVVIDPHAALENDIGGFSRVIDFKNTIDSIDLFINNSDDVIAANELLLELFKSLIADQYNSKLERVLRHAIHLLLTDESFNFQNLRNLLLNLEYRTNLIKKHQNNIPISVIDFFLTDFNDLKTKSYGEAISPIIGFIDEMEMLPVFNKNENFANLKNTIHDNFLTLFSLDRTKLGDKVTKTIAGLVMQQLLTIIQSYTINEHIIFVVDEVSVIENPILARFLSEARKYNLSLILAGQYFSQISEQLRNAIFANIVNYYIFRISQMDANILVDNFDMKIPLEDTKDRKIKLLTELNNRECIVRIDANGILLPAFKGSTLDYQSIPRIKINNSNAIINNECLPKFENKFQIDNTINLKDILLTTSSGRKDVK